jgi:hypothetical protein
MIDVTLRNTADVRRKLLEIWKLVDEKKISSSEARLHISLARAVLETLKVEIAAAHLAQTNIPSVPVVVHPPELLSRRAREQ